MTWISKTISFLWSKLKMAQTNGKIYILGLEESILWKWSYYSKQSTDSMQFLSKH